MTYIVLGKYHVRFVPDDMEGFFRTLHACYSDAIEAEEQPGDIAVVIASRWIREIPAQLADLEQRQMLVYLRRVQLSESTSTEPADEARAQTLVLHLTQMFAQWGGAV